MASADLLHLWKLHQIDAALVDIRARAAALDPGRGLMAKIEAAQKKAAETSAKAKALSGEQTDLELQQKSIDEKLKKINNDLYGGKFVNPREVEAYEKEIVALKRQRGDMDVRILELWELVPPAKEAAEADSKAVEELQSELKQHQKKALATKSQLEEEFKTIGAKRSAAAKEVPPSLLARYDAIRQRHGGIGMSRIAKNRTCGQCGTSLPTKVIEDVKEDKMVTCEQCHRILYFSESVA